MYELRGKNVPIKLWTDPTSVESVALDQLKNIAALPWVAHHVAVMPDVHYGKGATVGSVIAMRGACSPAAVGVDIGCGMAMVQTNLTASDLPDDLSLLRYDFEATVPVGFNMHEHPVWKRTPLALRTKIAKLMDRQKYLDRRVAAQRAERQLGTLGGGNHFIELSLDTDQNVWLMLHSGSRNVGKEIAEIHISVAKGLGHNEALVDRDLAVFLAGTPEMAAYERDLGWAQEYAFCNRWLMLERLKDVLREFRFANRLYFPQIQFGLEVLCHHNYLAREVHYGEELWVTRKGAIRAGAGDYGIIPGSMGSKSYLVRGLGNPESFMSASHGAGRRMSRGAAKRQFDLSDVLRQTAGVECRKDASVIDELPGAYKDIDEVIHNQADLVEVVAEVKAVLCVKG